jgi:hypothetical protein
MSAAVHVPDAWLLSALCQIDRAQQDDEIATAVRATRGLLGAVGLRFADLGRHLLQEAEPHLRDDAPVTAETIATMLAADYSAVPLPCLPGLGDLVKRLRAGRSPSDADVVLVRQARSAVRAAR